MVSVVSILSNLFTSVSLNRFIKAWCLASSNFFFSILSCLSSSFVLTCIFSFSSLFFSSLIFLAAAACVNISCFNFSRCANFLLSRSSWSLPLFCLLLINFFKCFSFLSRILLAASIAFFLFSFLSISCFICSSFVNSVSSTEGGGKGGVIFLVGDAMAIGGAGEAGEEVFLCFVCFVCFICFVCLAFAMSFVTLFFSCLSFLMTVLKRSSSFSLSSSSALAARFLACFKSC